MAVVMRFDRVADVIVLMIVIGVPAPGGVLVRMRVLMDVGVFVDVSMLVAVFVAIAVAVNVAMAVGMSVIMGMLMGMTPVHRRFPLAPAYAAGSCVPGCPQSVPLPKFHGP
ncbi:hypothetical protein GCM10027396_38170 [Insolitispirillum peregrinum]